MPTVYKLFTGILTATLSEAAERAGILSETQEGFRKGRSTQRQILWYQMVLEDAHRTPQPLRLLYIDLANAYTSVPHNKLLEVLRGQGIPEDFLTAIDHLYGEREGQKPSTTVRTPCGDTERISCDRGLLQGDPVSPVLFNLFLQPLLDWLEAGGAGYQPGLCPRGAREPGHGVGAFADDLILVAHSGKDMQAQAAKVDEFLTWAGMASNNGKCAYTGWAPEWETTSAPAPEKFRQMLAAEADEVRITEGENTQRIPSIGPDEPYRYLGAEIRADLRTDSELDTAL